MAILTKYEILAEIERGHLNITPFNGNNIGPASVDLTLDNKFRIFPGKKKVVIGEETDYKNYSKLVEKDSITLKPGQFVLGITKERIRLPDNMVGWLEGRSRFARLGLSIHITASFVQPGVDNRQVLEIINLAPHPLELKAGTKVCQLVLQRTEGKYKYAGKFASQEL
jgi:dCTP deaminase